MEQDRIDETLQYLPIFVTSAFCAANPILTGCGVFGTSQRAHEPVLEIKYTAASFTAAKAKCFDPDQAHPRPTACAAAFR